MSLAWNTKDPDFDLSIGSPEQTVFATKIATFNEMVTARYGFSGDVTLSCQGPAAMLCTGGTVTATQRGAQVALTSGQAGVGTYP